MSRDAPSWLVEFQARFGGVLRTPLDRASGTLAASTSAYDRTLAAEALSGPAAGGIERLAVYNRQYWFRLFGVLQSGFPLTSRLMGYWSFNEVAARYLLSHPPRGWDIEQVAEGFETFFQSSVDESTLGAREALVESVRIDAAYRDVFCALAAPAFRPSASDAPRLLAGHLVVSPALRLVEEHRALVALRRTLLEAPPSTGSVALPPPLARPQAWAILRTDDGTASLALERREAELVTLLGQRSVGDALASLERSCPPEDRALLPEQARAWLARSVQLGFWCGLRARG